MKNPSLPFDQGRALARLQRFWHRNFGALVCALALAGLTAFALGDTLTFARGGAGSWYDGVLRLHILANSDSAGGPGAQAQGARSGAPDSARGWGWGTAARTSTAWKPRRSGCCPNCWTPRRRSLRETAATTPSPPASPPCTLTRGSMRASPCRRGEYRAVRFVDWRGQGAQLVVRAVPADVPAGCFRGGAGGPRLHHPGAAGAHRTPAV